MLESRPNERSSESSSKNDPVVPSKKMKQSKDSASKDSTSHPQSQTDAIQKALSNLHEDECDVFGNYVASKMRGLSNPTLKRKMEREISKIILNILEEEDYLIERQQFPSPEYSNTNFHSMQSFRRPSPVPLPYDYSRISSPYPHSNTPSPAYNNANFGNYSNPSSTQSFEHVDDNLNEYS